jgi:hypothetical protein
MVVRVDRRGDANRLLVALPGDTARLERLDGHWRVDLRLQAETASVIQESFAALGRWLIACDLASCRLSFGDDELTLLQPRDGQVGDSVEALLERAVQLQVALDSRVAIDMATGFVAGSMDVSFEDAFSLLRDSARNRHLPLHQLAEQIIQSRDAPGPDDS